MRRLAPLAGALFIILFCVDARADDLLYTPAEADCAARFIYMNECSSKEENLLFWSADEDFPSLGIGHFIWYPAGNRKAYRESFPGLIDFLRERGVQVPAWLDLPVVPPAPWASREEFLAQLNSERSKQLRLFLIRTKRDQARYVLRRFRRIFPSILEELPPDQRRQVLEKYKLLMRRPQGGLFMADYANFKGEGLRSDARYEGVGWGLAQVLLEMRLPDDEQEALEEFTAAAERVLERRIAHSPRAEVESRWLPGWKRRLKGYLTFECG